MSAAPAAKSPRMNSIVVARGIAAVLVVFHHAGAIVAQPRFYGDHALVDTLARFTGVSFFFVLSGFFIGWINWRLIGQENKAWDFFSRRMIRIYPSYWLVLIPLIVLYQLVPSAGIESQRDPLNAVFSFLLLPYPAPPVYGVAWTLVHELLFAAVVSLVILWGRRAIWLLPVWACAIVIGNAFFDPMPYPLDFFLSSSNLQFLMGILTARLLRDRIVPMPNLLLAVGTLGYFGWIFFGLSITGNQLIERSIYAFSGCLIVGGLVGLERRRPIDLGPTALRLGLASYSVYLIHPIALSFLVNMSNRFAPNAPAEAVVVMIALVAIAAGMMFDWIIETPLNRLVRHWMDRRATRPSGLPVHARSAEGDA